MFPLIIICWLWSGGALQAQLGGAASCNDWSIEVCKEASASEYDPGCTADECSKVYYRFYLVNNSGTIPPGTDAPFSFTNFSIQCNLVATPGVAFLIGSGRSKVNTANSVSCTPLNPGLSDGATNNPTSSCISGGNCPLLSYEESNKTIAYQVSSVIPGSPTVNWTVQKRFLFLVLAIDVYPGETIKLDAFVANITYAPSGVNCDLPVDDTCDGIDLSTTIVNTMPVTCAPAYRLRLSPPIDIPTLENLNRKKINIFMSGPADESIKINELIALLLHVPLTTNLQNFTIEEGLLKISDLDIYSPFPNYSNKNILIDYRDDNGGLSLDFDGLGFSPTLFTVVYEGPVMASECASSTLLIRNDYGRIRSNTLSCCRISVPLESSSRTISFGNSSDCPEKCPAVRFSVEKPANQLTGCNGRFFEVWADADNTINLEDIYLVMDVKKSGTINFDAVNSSAQCSNCITSTVLTSGDIRVKLNLIAANPLIEVGTVASGGRQLVARVQFSGSAGVIQEVVFRDARILPHLAAKSCIPAVNSQITSLAADDIGFGSFMITAEAFKGTLEPIYYWTYFLNPSVSSTPPVLTDPLYDPLCTDPTGAVAKVNTVSPCACFLPNQTQKAALYLSNDPLNGVTTYDLILITRNILGLEPLSGYRLLAADANSSANVSTGDIVELRKLILGIYATLPQANSWRFIDKNIDVTGLVNITDLFPNVPGVYNAIPSYNKYFEQEFVPIRIPPSAGMDNIAEFVGYKIGDVNTSFIPDNQFMGIDDRSVAQFKLGIRPTLVGKGRSMEIPVFSLSEAALVGWQMALQYDTNQVQVKGIRWAQEKPPGSMQDQAWHQPAMGELRLLWFNAMGSFSTKTGTPLFYIELEAKNDLSNAAAQFKLSNSIPAECYNTTGELYRMNLELSSQKVLEPLVVEITDEQVPAPELHVYPNPAGRFYRIEINASIASSAQLAISDITGKMIMQREVLLQPGVNTIQAQQLPTLSAGQYIVRLDTEGASSVTKFSKE